MFQIGAGIEKVAEASKAGNCEQAQASIEDVRSRVLRLDKPVYRNKDGKEVRRDDLRDGVVLIQASIYGVCPTGLTDTERTVKIVEYLDREAKNGSMVAKKASEKLKNKAMPTNNADAGKGSTLWKCTAKDGSVLYINYKPVKGGYLECTVMTR